MSFFLLLLQEKNTTDKPANGQNLSEQKTTKNTNNQKEDVPADNTGVVIKRIVPDLDGKL